MSKYTTEVRYICETEAGLEESAGGNDVNSIIEKSRIRIFNFNYPIYDENYRSVLETKILKHFYTREIGFETVGLWKLKLDTKMNEIMPYYNQLYKSTLLEFNPLWTDDYSSLHNKKTDGTNERNDYTSLNSDSIEGTSGTVTNDETSLNSVKDTETLDQSRNNNNLSTENKTGTLNKTQDGVTVDTTKTVESGIDRDKYADTPQGALTDLEADRYLTNARKVTKDNTTNNDSSKVNNDKTTESTSDNADRLDINEERLSGNNEKTSDSSNIKSSSNNIDTTKTGANSTDTSSIGVNTFNNTEDYLEYVQGRRGKNASELLMLYRKTFLNIDMQIIDDLEELFIHLW